MTELLMFAGRQRKWLRGTDPIASLDALFAEASKPEDRRYVSTRYKNYDPRVVCSWQFAQVAAMIRDKHLAWATPNPNWKPRKAGPSEYAQMLYRSEPVEELPF